MSTEVPQELQHDWAGSTRLSTMCIHCLTPLVPTPVPNHWSRVDWRERRSGEVCPVLAAQDAAVRAEVERHEPVIAYPVAYYACSLCAALVSRSGQDSHTDLHRRSAK